MAIERPFRFGVQVLTAGTGTEWTAQARRVEALGYDTLLISDHFSGNFAPIAALTAAALATTTLRVGTTVAANDFRHPAMLAKEMATLDVLSDGRLEVGIGAGWLPADYEPTGIPFDPPGVRISRLQEAVQVIKGLWADGPVTFNGNHYTITNLEGWPKPLQRPRPPLFIGGGGRRILTYAAQKADIVGLSARSLPQGGVDPRFDDESLLAERAGWVHEAAGDREAQPQLSMLVINVVITDDAEAGAREIAGIRGWTPEQAAACPYILIGTMEAIIERLQELRERYGISYFTAYPRDLERLAPIVARLAGT